MYCQYFDRRSKQDSRKSSRIHAREEKESILKIRLANLKFDMIAFDLENSCSTGEMLIDIITEITACQEPELDLDFVVRFGKILLQRVLQSYLDASIKNHLNDDAWIEKLKGLREMLWNEESGSSNPKMEDILEEEEENDEIIKESSCQNQSGNIYQIYTKLKCC